MEYFVKASIVIALFYLCYVIFLKRETFFEQNRWFLLSGFIVALIFPLIVIPIEIPMETVTYAVPNMVVETSVQPVTQTTVIEQSFDWMQLIPIAYAIGLVVFLVQFILQFGSLAILLFNNPKKRDGFYTYVIIKSKIAPFSFFKWIVFNPKAYSDDELQMMLAHEKVHVNQFHSVDIIITQLICAIFWFNPIVWFYKKDITQNLEFIADKTTQNTLDDDKHYQRLLLKTSIRYQNMALTNNFYNSLIKKRIVMLQKSKSKSKKKWRYALILPIVFGLLLSMNTKEVYVETESFAVEENKETVEFVVTKHSADSDLEWMSKSIKEKGGSLVFSDLKRNKNNELTNIFVKLNNRSYGGGDSKTPIKAFIIYKELYGKGGGFVGRPNGATIHFDKPDLKDITDAEINALKKRAISKMKVLGLDIESEIASKKSKNNKTPKAKVKASQKAKSVSKSQSIVSSSSLQLIEIKITKTSTDTELESIVEDLKAKGVTIKFKGVKRNSNGEITAIKIDAKKGKNSSNYSVKSDNGIAPIVIGYNESNGHIAIGNRDTKVHRNHFTYVTKDGKKKHKIRKSKTSNVYVYSTDDEDGEEIEEKIVIGKWNDDGKVKIIKKSDGNIIHEEDVDVIFEKLNDSSKLNIGNGKVLEIIKENDGKSYEVIVEDDGDVDVEEEVIVNGKKMKIVKKKVSRNIWISDDDNDENVFIFKNKGKGNSNIIINNENGKNPIFVIDGKVHLASEVGDLDFSNIKSMTVLKGDKAVEKYGEKAKDGAIEIITN